MKEIYVTGKREPSEHAGGTVKIPDGAKQIGATDARAPARSAASRDPRERDFGWGRTARANIERRLLAGIGAVLTSLGLVVAAAPPAQAAVFNCPDGDVCLFDGTWYGMYSTWFNSAENIYNSSYPAGSPPHCINFVDGGWAFGYMNNAASSVVVNPAFQTAYTVRFWPNLNCAGYPVMWTYFTSLKLDGDLRDGAPDFHVTDNRSNTITSVSVTYN